MCRTSQHLFCHIPATSPPTHIRRLRCYGGDQDTNLAVICCHGNQHPRDLCLSSLAPVAGGIHQVKDAAAAVSTVTQLGMAMLNCEGHSPGGIMAFPFFKTKTLIKNFHFTQNYMSGEMTRWQNRRKLEGVNNRK